jgi:hypothetical protein
MLNQLKRLLGKLRPDEPPLEPVTITDEEALSIARAECDRLGLYWGTPVSVGRHKNMWIVHTGIQTRGAGNNYIEIDGNTGQIIHASGQIR